MGLEGRFGVADRELPGLRVLAADAERAVLSPGALASRVDAIVEAALFLRVALRVLGDLSKDGSGRSLARSMVVLRLFAMACRFDVSAFGVSGNGGLGFLARSFIRLSAFPAEGVLVCWVAV